MHMHMHMYESKIHCMMGQPLLTQFAFLLYLDHLKWIEMLTLYIPRD